MWVGRRDVVEKQRHRPEPCAVTTDESSSWPACHLAVRSESGDEHVAAKISIVSSLKRSPERAAITLHEELAIYPYLARQLSDGEIWTAHEGVNPCVLVVRRGDRELRTRLLC
jgi:hypothetical protein